MQRRELIKAALLSSLAGGLMKLHEDPLLIRDLGRRARIPTPHLEGDSPLAKISTRPDRWGVASRARQAPTIDGNLDDPQWAEAQALTGFVTPFYHEAIDADVSLRFLYDDQHVYVAISYASEDAGASVAQIDILLSPAGGGDQYFRVPLIIRAVKPSFNLDWGPGITDLTVTDTAFLAGEDGITAEIKVPIADLASESIALGDEWRANVIIQHEMMTKPLSTWIPIRTSMHRFNGQGGAAVQAEVTAGDHLGSIFMGAIPTLPQHPKPPQMFSPGASTLVYKGFTDKELTFAVGDIRPRDEVHLEWKAPGQVWAPLEDSSEERDRSTITIRFNHPAPMDKGHYQLRVLVSRSQAHERSVDKVAILTFDRLDLIRAGQLVQPTAVVKQPVKRVPRRAASQETERLLGLIPDRSGFRFVGLPDQPLLHPDKVFTWDPDNPDVLASAHSDLVYPHDQYPENKTITVTNGRGEKVDYPYYEDGDGKRYFISAHICFQKKEYVLGAIEGLAATDPLGAARVLYSLVNAYQGWVSTNEYPWFNRPVEAASVPANFYWGGHWSRWSASELYGFQHLPSAYAVVAETDAFDVLSEEVGTDVRDAIVHHMFEPSVDFHRSFSMIYHNMDYTNNLGLVSMGLALKDSSYLHEVVEWAIEYARVTYLFDGFYKETSLSYHDQATGGIIKVLDAIKGWTDPGGYVSPRSGQRFDDLDLRAQTPVLVGAENVGNMVVYPDNKLFPMDDTWAFAVAGAPQLEAGSFLLPASGLARLSRGTAPSPSQTYLKFTTKYGHHHYDPLSLALYAEGQELLPDLGYSHTFYRRWSISGLGHNTVVVDSADMETEGAASDGGDIEVFAQPSEMVQVVRASQGTAYPQTDDYRREVWSIGFGSADNAGYVLDLFRVKGGDRHEYTLHGDANHDATFTTDAQLADYGPYLLPEGVKVTEPTTETDRGDAEGHYYGYIYVRKVQRAELADGGYGVTLATQDGDGTPLAGAKIIGLGDGVASELFIGESPSLRATRLEGTSKDINSEAVKYWMPKLVVRRDGTDLQSQFVTLIEPYAAGAAAQVDSAERQAVDQGADGSIAVQVTHGTITEVILSSSDPEQPMLVGDVTLTGKLGLIRLEDGAVTEMYLVGGTSLAKGSTELTDDGPVTGMITAVRRRADGDTLDALVADTVIPQSMIGNTLVVTHPDDTTHGYKIKSMADDAGSTVIEIDGVDPGFTFAADGGTELQFFPFTKWTGDTIFRIENSVRR